MLYSVFLLFLPLMMPRPPAPEMDLIHLKLKMDSSKGMKRASFYHLYMHRWVYVAASSVHECRLSHQKKEELCL